MDFESINDQIKIIESNLESIKEQIQICENQEKIEKQNPDDTGSENKIFQANRMREIYSLIAKGLTSWQVAEQVKDLFPSVWDAYFFITHCLNEEKARKKYALHFLVHALSEYGLSNAKISKIAGYTPQRCGQILKKSCF